MIYKLTPTTKNYIWGGNKLVEHYGKKSEATPLAESWELSFHPDGKSLIDGVPVDVAVSAKQLGTNLNAFERFPVLVKLIDARDNLSVQVHPSDEMALSTENSYGKTEMWYVVEADEGAGIYIGFEQDVTMDEVRRAAEENTLTDLLHFQPVQAGDYYFIPAGTVHAIGKGCLIAEVQQNSNLTYRLYDYGRVGADGKPRELHLEKALAASILNRFENNSLHSIQDIGTIIGASKYFTTTIISADGEISLPTDPASFRLILSLSAEGEIDGMPLRRGESYLAAASDDAVKLSAHGDLLLVEVRRYTVGIDLGGTFIKGGIVDDLGRILVSDQIPTESDKGADAVADNIATLTASLLRAAGLKISDVGGIGMGVPGMINSTDGIVTYSNNLRWADYAISDRVRERTGLPVRIANDANVATLGEAKFGAARGANITVMLTLGTGVGGGAVIDGRLLEGNLGAGAEFGHSTITFGNRARRCSCGRRGCLEAYASASAFVRDTKEAMKRNPESRMWEAGSLDTVDGRTAFAYRHIDRTARRVIDNYVAYLGEGLANFANVFRPDVLLLGGGLSAQGDALIVPLQEYLNQRLFGGTLGPAVRVAAATLGNRAGIVGAAALFME